MRLLFVPPPLRLAVEGLRVRLRVEDGKKSVLLRVVERREVEAEEESCGNNNQMQTKRDEID